MTRLRGWRAVLASTCAAAVLLVAPGASPVDAAGVTAHTVQAANVVSFTYDARHPRNSVVGSSTTYTRAPGQPLLLTISVAPGGRSASIQATLRNTSGTPLVFGAKGVRVEARLANAATNRGGTVWTMKAPALRTLAPGASHTVSGAFPLPRTGTYTVVAAARF